MSAETLTHPQAASDLLRFVTESRGSYQWPAVIAKESQSKAWICTTEPFQTTDVREGLDRHMIFTHLGAEDVNARFSTSSARMSEKLAHKEKNPTSLSVTKRAKWNADRVHCSRSSGHFCSQSKASYGPIGQDALQEQIKINRAARQHVAPSLQFF
uniref:Uncharacterized protein n=1 Tax=Spongospora subterranea TaxID=70186 RepID=A0A0H5RBF3_9EUKA|eukprot:CRZ11545.1 hypothetical protein [Spongospora subterranea]